MRSVPPALAAAFESKVTITAAELCRLLPLAPKTLMGHIRRGHIGFIQTGFGEKAPRRAFTLEAVLSFLERQSRSMDQYARLPARLATSTAVGDFRAARAKLLSDHQRAREEMLARNAQAGRDMQDKPRGASGGRAKAKARA